MRKYHNCNLKTLNWRSPFIKNSRSLRENLQDKTEEWWLGLLKGDFSTDGWGRCQQQTYSHHAARYCRSRKLRRKAGWREENQCKSSVWDFRRSRADDVNNMHSRHLTWFSRKRESAHPQLWPTSAPFGHSATNSNIYVTNLVLWLIINWQTQSADEILEILVIIQRNARRR